RLTRRRGAGRPARDERAGVRAHAGPAFGGYSTGPGAATYRAAVRALQGRLQAAGAAARGGARRGPKRVGGVPGATSGGPCPPVGGLLPNNSRTCTQESACLGTGVRRVRRSYAR